MPAWRASCGGCSSNQNLNFDFFANPGGDSFTAVFTTNGGLTSGNNVPAVFFGGPGDNAATAKFVFPDGQMVEVLFRTEVRDNGCRIHFAGHHLVVEQASGSVGGDTQSRRRPIRS